MVVKPVQRQEARMKAQAPDLKRSVAGYLAATEFSLAVDTQATTLFEELWTIITREGKCLNSGWFKMDARQALPRHTTAHNQHATRGLGKQAQRHTSVASFLKALQPTNLATPSVATKKPPPACKCAEGMRGHFMR